MQSNVQMHFSFWVRDDIGEEIIGSKEITSKMTYFKNVELRKWIISKMIGFENSYLNLNNLNFEEGIKFIITFYNIDLSPDELGFITLTRNDSA